MTTEYTPDDIADHIETVINAHAELWQHIDEDTELSTELTGGNQITVTIEGDGGEQRFTVTVTEAEDDS